MKYFFILLAIFLLCYCSKDVVHNSTYNVIEHYNKYVGNYNMYQNYNINIVIIFDTLFLLNTNKQQIASFKIIDTNNLLTQIIKPYYLNKIIYSRNIINNDTIYTLCDTAYNQLIFQNNIIKFIQYRASFYLKIKGFDLIKNTDLPKLNIFYLTKIN